MGEEASSHPHREKLCGNILTYGLMIITKVGKFYLVAKMARPKGSCTTGHRKKNTLTLPPDHWKTLLSIGPSYGKAVESLIDDYKRKTMIDLCNGFRFGKNDSLNFVIEKAKIIATGKRAGEITWKTVGHYTNLQRCCNALLKCCTDMSTIDNIHRLQEQLTSIEKSIIQACDTINGTDIRLHIVDNGGQALIAAIDNALLSAPRGNGKRVVFSEITHNRGWHSQEMCTQWGSEACENCPGCQRITIDEDNYLVTDINGEWSFYNNGDNMDDAMSDVTGELDYTKRWATAYIRDEMKEGGDPHVFRFVGNKCTYEVPNSRWSLESFKQRVYDE